MSSESMGIDLELQAYRLVNVWKSRDPGVIVIFSLLLGMSPSGDVGGQGQLSVSGLFVTTIGNSYIW